MEQSVGDSCRHCAMAALSSALDFGAHPVAGYYRGYTVRLRVRIRIMIGFRVRVSVRVRVTLR